MRLAKFLATAGVAARRKAEILIAEGHVTVNGNLEHDPARAVSDEDKILVDGEPVGKPQQTVVYALNKPTRVVSTASDPQGRTTVCDLVKSETRLYPVGRLDIDTTGLILLTNDGELAHLLTHPRYEVPKTYRAKVRRLPIRSDAIRQLREGVQLDDGLTAPAKVRKVSADTLEITIHEGRKRQVRRMCKAVGHSVIHLERIRIGSLQLGDLAEGEYRQLSDKEVAQLRGAAEV